MQMGNNLTSNVKDPLAHQSPGQPKRGFFFFQLRTTKLKAERSTQAPIYFATQG